LVNGGIVEVSNNKCTLLSEDVVKTSDYKDQKTDDKIEIEKIRVSKKLYYY
jgi:F0F1-type ATP synthase epsilon subunit